MKKVTILILSIAFSCQEIDMMEPVQEIDNRIENPNFIFIITDDQRFDALGKIQAQQGSNGRFPWLKTPNLDQLAESGMLFTKAFVVNSLCSPSRATILTGTYQSAHGVVDNHTAFNARTFASTLVENGYETAYFGKWHMGEQQAPLPGFVSTYIFHGQGQYETAEFFLNGTKKVTDKWIDFQSTDYLINHLKKYSNDPFLYMIGYKSTHQPWDSPPEEYDNIYMGETVRPVPNLESEAIYSKVARNSIIFEDYEGKIGIQDIVYFQYIAAIDECIGKIVHEIQSLGLEENTYLIFMSDNGFYMGEHKLRDKRTAYEESIRIPLIISGPGISSNSINDQIVLNLDISETILDLAGMESQLDSDGESLVPLLFNQSIDWRSDFIYRYTKEKYTGPAVNVLAIRSHTHKIIFYDGYPEWTELFDLTMDPYETINQIDNPEYSNVRNYFNKRLVHLTTRYNIQ